LIVSGDQFIASDDAKKRILSIYPDALAAEMEGAAIGQVATQFNTPFVVIRAMSDTADGDAGQSFDEFIVDAGKRSAQMLLSLHSPIKGSLIMQHIYLDNAATTPMAPAVVQAMTDQMQNDFRQCQLQSLVWAHCAY
jgi:hypothetical protein